jgi:FMN reductase
MNARKLHIVGLGGASHTNSNTERFLRLALDAAEAAGASTSLLGGQARRMPMYAMAQRNQNALDYVGETRADERPHFSGSMAVAGGWQRAAVSGTSSLRGIVHALRGWPTPVGIAINSNEASADGSVQGESAQVAAQIRTMAKPGH